MIFPSLSMADYVSDSLGDPRPALSASAAHTLLARSPRHAWHAHPKLNPAWQRHEEAKFDLGTAIHAIALGDNGTTFDVIAGYDDWRKNEAKDRRDAARAAGRLPLLEHQYNEAKEAVDSLRQQLALHEIGNPFSAGAPEVTLTWEMDGVLCKARLDWMPPAREGDVCFYDLKSTTDSANPMLADRRLDATGCYLQAAFHSAGIVANFPAVRPRFAFILLEVDQPYAMSVVEPDAVGLEMAQQDVARAVALWKRCLSEDRWPGYPSRVCTLDTAAWKIGRAEERAAVETREAADGVDAFAAAMVW